MAATCQYVPFWTSVLHLLFPIDGAVITAESPIIEVEGVRDAERNAVYTALKDSIGAFSESSTAFIEAEKQRLASEKKLINALDSTVESFRGSA